MQYLSEKLNVLKEYKKTLDFLCWLTINSKIHPDMNKKRNMWYYMDILLSR